MPIVAFTNPEVHVFDLASAEKLVGTIISAGANGKGGFGGGGGAFVKFNIPNAQELAKQWKDLFNNTNLYVNVSKPGAASSTSLCNAEGKGLLISDAKDDAGSHGIERDDFGWAEVVFKGGNGSAGDDKTYGGAGGAGADATGPGAGAVGKAGAKHATSFGGDGGTPDGQPGGSPGGGGGGKLPGGSVGSGGCGQVTIDFHPYTGVVYPPRFRTYRR